MKNLGGPDPLLRDRLAHGLYGDVCAEPVAEPETVDDRLTQTVDSYRNPVERDHFDALGQRSAGKPVDPNRGGIELGRLGTPRKCDLHFVGHFAGAIVIRQRRDETHDSARHAKRDSNEIGIGEFGKRSEAVHATADRGDDSLIAEFVQRAGVDSLRKGILCAENPSVLLKDFQGVAGSAGHHSVDKIYPTQD